MYATEVCAEDTYIATTLTYINDVEVDFAHHSAIFPVFGRVSCRGYGHNKQNEGQVSQSHVDDVTVGGRSV